MMMEVLLKYTPQANVVIFVAFTLTIFDLLVK